jgi:hypothetical protein
LKNLKFLIIFYQIEDFKHKLPMASECLEVTAILEAGSLSLQNNGRRVEIVYGEDGLISELKII